MKRKVRIGIDGRVFKSFLSANGIGGITYFSQQLCYAIDQVAPEQYEFHVIGQENCDLSFCSKRWKFHSEPYSLLRRIKSVLWTRFRANQIINDLNIDVYLALGSFLPLGLKPKSILMVYDLNYVVVPQTMATTHKFSYQLFFSNSVKTADRITTISLGTADRVKDHFKRIPSAIIYPCVRDTLINGPAHSVPLLSGKKFFFAHGTREPRKNIGVLVQAFSILKSMPAFAEHKLVLSGADGWGASKYSEQISSNSDIIELNIVTDNELKFLYENCDCFVFPSLYEGFGMPVLEARVLGAPVVATDIPEIREAGGKAVYYSQPNAKAFANSIELAVQNTRLSDSIDRLENDFDASWEQQAEKLLDVISELLKEKYYGRS